MGWAISAVIWVLLCLAICKLISIAKVKDDDVFWS